MKLSYPAYYADFRCLAGSCPDSCCRLWDIDVDEKTEQLYRSTPGDFGERLRSALRTGEDGTVIAQVGGKCPLWRADGLCGVQTELGHEALCRVCREFPRMTHDYGTFRELGLDLSCPEAARLILTASHRTVTEELPGSAEPEYEEAAMELLLQSREQMRKLIENRTLSVAQMLCTMLLYACAVQEALYGDELTELDPIGAWETAAQMGEKASLRDVASFYKTLEILTPDWERSLERAGECPVLNDAVRPLTDYFVTRYWLQAVSDLDILGRAKFILVSCLLIAGLPGDLTENACRYSKEIESDPENMEAILDACYDHPAFTDTRLLYLLRKAAEKE